MITCLGTSFWVYSLLDECFVPCTLCSLWSSGWCGLRLNRGSLLELEAGLLIVRVASVKKGVSALVGGWSSDCWYIVSGPAGGILCQRSDFSGVNGSGGLEALSQVVAWGSGSGHDPWWGRGLLQEFCLCHGQLSIWKGHLVWEVKLTLSWQEGINKSLANPKGEKVWFLGK